jgi:AcrR family transcriptional regulator
MSPRTQAERREETVTALICAGRALFAARGFDAVAAEEIVAAAGVTRGALYHHFDGKKGLFEAVFISVEREMLTHFPIEKLTGADAFGALHIGVEHFLELSLGAEVQRITLVDGPAVLGWSRWHEIEAEHGLGLIQAGLQAAMDAGQVKPLPVGPLATALLGALVESALLVARAPDPDAAKVEAAQALQGLLSGLRT